jgi:argininosuccinate synthase
MRIEDLRNKKVGICVSGGLDSRTIARKLIDSGVNVVCFTADLAQPDEEDIRHVGARMEACGAETIIVDLKKDMAEACFSVIKAQAVYDGGYWNTTGIARAVTVRGLIPEMKGRGCAVLAHGATGRGNDQMRFERYTNVLAPDMGVYAPWRDPALLKEFPGRKEMAEYLKRHGVEAFPGGKKRYSTDANLAGLSHEAEDLESVETPCTIVEPKMGVWPMDAPDEPELFTVRFEKARAVDVNGARLSPFEAMQQANRIGGRNGIGLRNALENRIVGTKSRGVYEAPGMELLGFCLLQVYQAVMDSRSTRLFRHLSQIVAAQVYDGRYFDPVTTASMAGIDALAGFASAEVTVSLYKGNIHFQGLRGCAASLYNEADSSMEASAGLNPTSSQGFAEIQSVEALAMARAGQIRNSL